VFLAVVRRSFAMLVVLLACAEPVRAEDLTITADGVVMLEGTFAGSLRISSAVATSAQAAAWLPSSEGRLRVYEQPVATAPSTSLTLPARLVAERAWTGEVHVRLTEPDAVAWLRGDLHSAAALEGSRAGPVGADNGGQISWLPSSAAAL
jgi:hypothetical protein